MTQIELTLQAKAQPDQYQCPHCGGSIGKSPWFTSVTWGRVLCTSCGQPFRTSEKRTKIYRSWEHERNLFI